MKIKKLESPEFRVTIGQYELTEGIQVECFSNRSAHMDWCKITLCKELQGVIQFEDMEDAVIELGYEGDYDILIPGYVRNQSPDYFKEITVKDDMLKLEKISIKGTFTSCTPQDIINYVLTCAGITGGYKLDETVYQMQKVFSLNTENAIQAIQEVNSFWGIANNFYFQNKVFYWGQAEPQKEIYILEEGENILSLNKYGTMWEAEIICIPWIHHSQQIEIAHSKYTGTIEVQQTIIRSDEKGAVRMFVYW